MSTPRSIAPGIELLFVCGNCPVQADGYINAAPFYFRSRGEHWSLEVGRGNTALVVDAMLGVNPGDGLSMFGDDLVMQDIAREAQKQLECWRYEEEYGEWPEAGYITDEEAIAFIVQGAALYRAAVPSGWPHSAAPLATGAEAPKPET